MGSLNTTLSRVVVPSAVAAAVLLGTAGTASASVGTDYGGGSAVGGGFDDPNYDENLPVGMSRDVGGNSGSVCTALFGSSIDSEVSSVGRAPEKILEGVKVR